MEPFYTGIEVRRIIKLRRLMSFFDHTFQPGYHFKGESHNFWEFVLILDGSAGVCAGEEIFHIHKGQCLWHRPNEFHSIWTEGDTPMRLGIFSFDGEVELPVSGKIFRAGTAICNEFSELRREADEIFEFGDNGTDGSIMFSGLRPNQAARFQVIIGKMEALLAQALCNEQPKERLNSQSAENYLRLVSVITANLNKRLSISELAAECRMSEANAKRVFAKYAGCGIYVYYN